MDGLCHATLLHCVLTWCLGAGLSYRNTNGQSGGCGAELSQLWGVTAGRAGAGSSWAAHAQVQVGVCGASTMLLCLPGLWCHMAHPWRAFVLQAPGVFASPAATSNSACQESSLLCLAELPSPVCHLTIISPGKSPASMATAPSLSLTGNYQPDERRL